jgi:hypothetical protein
MVRGDVAVIPGNVEHEGFFPEETEVVDIFARSQIVADRLRKAIGTRSDGLAE